MSGAKNIQIAILDDNRSTRNLAKVVIENNLSCEVRISASPEGLYALFKSLPPDLILLDIDLGKNNGVDVCRQLKEDPRTSGIPIVFLSTLKDPAKRVAALKAGGVDYIDKPFYPEELVTRVKTHVEIHRLKLENIDRISDQQALLHVLCHDLVNPIFAAHSLLCLRRDTRKVDDMVIERVIGCCQNALDIIVNVRAEEAPLVGKDKPFEGELVSVEEAFNESANVLGQRFEEKNVELVIDCAANPQLSIKRVILVQNILNNLLTNALKFSYPKNTVSLRSYSGKRKGESVCIIEVKDTGIGMPPEILNAVFDREAKVSRKGTSSEKGTGFGMPLVKRYVELSGGTVAVESVEEQAQNGEGEHGTTVKLVFPC